MSVNPYESPKLADSSVYYTEMSSTEKLNAKSFKKLRQLRYCSIGVNVLTVLWAISLPVNFFSMYRQYSYIEDFGIEGEYLIDIYVNIAGYALSTLLVLFIVILNYRRNKVGRFLSLFLGVIILGTAIFSMNPVPITISCIILYCFSFTGDLFGQRRIKHGELKNFYNAKKQERKLS